jgi:ubiquinone/menaquinone biosynthesis C-methylase UbiE
LKNLNCENLLGILDESQDVYFASSVLHIVENPEKMISEAYRILKKGGKAGFSVWGDPEKSSFFTIINNAIIKCGYEPEEKRFFFDL